MFFSNEGLPFDAALQAIESLQIPSPKRHPHSLKSRECRGLKGLGFVGFGV